MIINFSDNGIMRFSNFTEILQKCFNSYFGIDNATLCAAYPSVIPDNNELKLPIITYKYFKTPSEVGSVAKNTELKPRHRETIVVFPDGNENEKENGVHVDVYGQKFSYKVQFEVWGTNGQQADEYTEKFEAFMNTYSAYFKSKGIVNLIFKGIDPVQEKNQWRSDLIKRTLTYELMIDEITNLQTHSLRSITVGVSTEFSQQYMILDDEALENILMS